MVAAVAHRRPVGDLLFRVDDLVRTVAQEELGMDVPGGPGEHKGSTIFLEQCGGFQRALEAVSDGHHAEIEVPHPQGADKLGIGK